MKDLITGAVTRVSTDANGGQANDSSLAPVFSPDGTKLVFDSSATTLVPGDTNGVIDAFVKDLVAGGIALLATDANGQQGNGYNVIADLSPFSSDGTKITFQSFASNLLPNDTNGAMDIFERPINVASAAVIDNPQLATLTAEDTFHFSDANLSDTHIVSVVLAGTRPDRRRLVERSGFGVR